MRKYKSFTKVIFHTLVLCCLVAAIGFQTACSGEDCEDPCPPLMPDICWGANTVVSCGWNEESGCWEPDFEICPDGGICEAGQCTFPG